MRSLSRIEAKCQGKRQLNKDSFQGDSDVVL